MADEKKARKMGAASKALHKGKTRECPWCGGNMTWCRVVVWGMRFVCDNCGKVVTR